MAGDAQRLIDLPEKLTGARVELRPFQAGDAVAYWEAIEESRADLSRWLSWVRTCDNLREAKLFTVRARIHWLQRDDLMWGVFSTTTGQLLGMLELQRINWDLHKFELGYWLRSSAQGCGYAQEACRLLIQFAFETLQACRIELWTDATNLRSRRLAERLGFSTEGIMRRAARSASGEITDRCIYGLLEDEYRQPANR